MMTEDNEEGSRQLKTPSILATGKISMNQTKSAFPDGYNVTIMWHLKIMTSCNKYVCGLTPQGIISSFRIWRRTKIYARRTYKG